MRRVLITGGAGYLGSSMVSHFINDFEVTVVDRLLYDRTSLLQHITHPNFKFIKGDVRDERLMKQLVSKSDVILPLAALVGFPLCDRMPHEAVEVNRDACKMIADLKERDQIVIYPCTNSGYGSVDGSKLCTEDTPMKPITLYGQTKVEAEEIFRSTQGCTTLRLATVFGPSPRMRTDLLVNSFVLKALRERALILYEDAYMRNYIHIQDICRAFRFIVDRWDECSDQTFNVGNDALNCTKRQLAEQVAALVPCSIYVTEKISDPDQRDYIVSSQRFYDRGFVCKNDLSLGVKQLQVAYSLLDEPWHANY